jgi:hypothetical protein
MMKSSDQKEKEGTKVTTPWFPLTSYVCSQLISSPLWKPCEDPTEAFMAEYILQTDSVVNIFKPKAPAP